MYLIAHTNSQGTGIAQLSVNVRSAKRAREVFAKTMPERVLTVCVHRKTARES